jgi:hypothetical protein
MLTEYVVELQESEEYADRWSRLQTKREVHLFKLRLSHDRLRV